MDIKVISDNALEKEAQLFLPKETLQKRIGEVLQKKAQRMRVPGFRPGKAPLDYVYREEGRRASGEVLGQLVQEALLQLTTEKKWTIEECRYSPHQIDPGKSLDEQGDVTVDVKILLQPDFPELDTIKTTLEDLEVSLSDEEVDAEVTKRAASVMDAKPLAKARPAKKGDTLIYHLTYIDSKGGEHANEGSFILGSGKFPKEFEDTLEGVDAGHTIEERIRVPKDFPIAAIAGQKVLFRVIFKEILETVPFSADDRFAKAQGAKDLKSYKETVRTEAEKYYSDSFTMLHHIDQLRDFLAKTLTFDIPHTIAKEYIEGRIKRIEEDTASLKDKDKEAYFKERGLKATTFKEEIAKQAEKDLRVDMFLAHVAKKQDFTVTTEEMRSVIDSLAARWNTSVEQAMAFLQKNPAALQSVRQDYLNNKALFFLIGQCEKKKKSVTLAQAKKQS